MSRLRNIGRLRAGGGGGGTPGYNPATALTTRLIYWNDPTDLAVTWQDSARTTGAAVNSPVGSRQNKGTANLYMQQTVGGSRQVLRQSGGLYLDELDGLDDSSGSSASLDLSAFDKLTICYGLIKESDAAVGILAELSATWVSNFGTFFTAVPGAAASSNLSAASRGTAASSASLTATATGVAAPIAMVLTVTHDIAGDSTVVRVNGVQVATAVGDKGNGNFANLPYFEGRRNNTSFPFLGKLGQRVIVSGLLVGAELTELETFVAASVGVTV